MTPKAAFIKWFLVGVVAATLLIWGQATETGGLAGLLQVGETSTMRPVIEDELGRVPLAPAGGHDGQIYYYIALDLDGSEAGRYLEEPGLRYRRIFYPLLSSGLGALHGESLLYGMITVAGVAFALASGAAAAIARNRGLSDWLALAVILNPGMWLSVRLLTPDSLAVATMLGAMWLYQNRNATSAGAFSISALTKDAFVLTPLGLAAKDLKRRWTTVVFPSVVLLVWVLVIGTLMGGNGFTPRGNLDWPFLGMINAVPVWGGFDAAEFLYLSFALISVAIGLIVGFVSRNWLRWSILAWALLGVVSSNWVWDLGNNAARVFAPIVILVALSVGAERRSHPRRSDESNPSE